MKAITFIRHVEDRYAGFKLNRWHGITAAAQNDIIDPVGRRPWECRVISGRGVRTAVDAIVLEHRPDRSYRDERDDEHCERGHQDLSPRSLPSRRGRMVRRRAQGRAAGSAERGAFLYRCIASWTVQTYPSEPYCRTIL